MDTETYKNTPYVRVEKGLTPIEKFFLLVIKDKGGVISGNYKLIARNLKVSDRQLRDCCHNLENQGFLSIQKPINSDKSRPKSFSLTPKSEAFLLGIGLDN